MWTEPSSFPYTVFQVALLNLLAYAVLSAIAETFYPGTRKNLEAAEFDYRRYLARISEFRRRMSLELCEDSAVLFRHSGDSERELPLPMRRDWFGLSSPTFFIGLAVCGTTVGAFTNTNWIPLIAIGLAVFAALPVIFSQVKRLGKEQCGAALPPLLRKAGAQNPKDHPLTQASGSAPSDLVQHPGSRVRRLEDLHQQGHALEGIDMGPGNRPDAFEHEGANERLASEGCCSHPLGSLFLELTSLYDLEQRLRFSRNKLGCWGRFQAGYFVGLLVFTIGTLCSFERDSAMAVLQLPSLWSVLAFVFVLGWFWVMKIPRFVRLHDLVS